MIGHILAEGGGRGIVEGWVLRGAGHWMTGEVGVQETGCWGWWACRRLDAGGLAVQDVHLVCFINLWAAERGGVCVQLDLRMACCAGNNHPDEHARVNASSAPSGFC